MDKPEFNALSADSILLTLINEDNLAEAREMFSGFPDSEYMLGELERSYIPRYDEQGRRTKYGFYIHYNDQLAGLTMLGIDNWQHRRAYTGADILSHRRGRGITPLCKPLLFYLAFEILDMNRVETGCFVSNTASKRSIEKTPGFKLEGILREYCRNEKGGFEDEYRYSILKKEWAKLYDTKSIKII
jgi:RimJ/RimL family protein N-acetyltransferase